MKEINDAVRPYHYDGNGSTKCADALSSMLAGYERGRASLAAAAWCAMAVKYVWRWPLKNRVQDLRKAVECLRHAIEEQESADECSAAGCEESMDSVKRQ